MPIPRIIIQTWKTKKLPLEFLEWSLTWKKYNPEFSYLFFDDGDCFRFIFKNYPMYLDLYESLSNIERADIFRYLALHHYGGIYADIDTSCFKPIGPLLDLFDNSLITGIEYNNPEQYLQWFIACPKGSEIMIELVNEANKRNWIRPFKMLTLSDNELVYYITGPVMFTNVLKNSTESLVVLEKGLLGCYDQKLINRNSYLQHHFASTWKIKKYGQNLKQDS